VQLKVFPTPRMIFKALEAIEEDEKKETGCKTIEAQRERQLDSSSTKIPRKTALKLATEATVIMLSFKLKSLWSRENHK